MKDKYLFPKLGELFRHIVTTTGYRSYFVEKGCDKDLDDMANESRYSHELLCANEKKLWNAIGNDCGEDWYFYVHSSWQVTKQALLMAVLNVDSSAFIEKKDTTLVDKYFSVPTLSQFVRLLQQRMAGPNILDWFDKPFSAWIKYAAISSGNTEKCALEKTANHFKIDERTIQNWMLGNPLGKAHQPYRTLVASLFSNVEQDSKKIDHLCGWLLLSIAFQSLEPDFRNRVMRDFFIRPQHPWSMQQSIAKMQDLAVQQGASPYRNDIIKRLSEIEALFAERPVNFQKIKNELNNLNGLVAKLNATQQLAYQYIVDWFSARKAALEDNQAKALQHYKSAVDGVWWFGGQNQHPIINEALCYSVGIGKKIDADYYWDKTFALGLNKGPKSELDDQELRRISFAFENNFSPLKAKNRIPPAVRFGIDDDFSTLTKQQLSKPNQKVKLAERRLVVTPLMLAIQDKSLHEVKHAIEAGGDPNDFIKDSGEGPLSYALRRAADRKDTAILEHILTLDLSPEAVNRPASTQKETPLKIAIDMGNANVVGRLIELGADIEAQCGYSPSALCHAMAMYADSKDPTSMKQEQRYFAGKIKADVYDAKDGAVLDIDLRARRQRFADLINKSERNNQIYQETKAYFLRKPEQYLQIIQLLLAQKADPNRRYKVEETHIEEWTPTLFAAELGNLELFKMMLSYGGNPNLSLMPPESFVKYDALWVAVDHAKHEIVSYLNGLSV